MQIGLQCPEDLISTSKHDLLVDFRAYGQVVRATFRLFVRARAILTAY